jgi:hypothetical protein
MKIIILFYESLNKFQNYPILLNGTLSKFNFSLIIEGATEKEEILLCKFCQVRYKFCFDEQKCI